LAHTWLTGDADFHLLDRDLGSTPATDLPFFAIIAVVFVFAAVLRAGEFRRLR
jgi:hypothetical protein